VAWIVGLLSDRGVSAEILHGMGVGDADGLFVEVMSVLAAVAGRVYGVCRGDVQGWLLAQAVAGVDAVGGGRVDA
jgi:hypothetical protein